ncbi:MAG: SulP family inorganic anion transporter [Thermoleophilia bacterium]
MAGQKGSAVNNIVGGFVAGLYSVPEGIGYASLAGINPMLGIYAGMVPVAVTATGTGSVLMMSTLTSAIALTTAGILAEGGYQGAEVLQAVVTMSLLAGVIMFVLGLLKLGKIVNFVSNAVMTGFVAGVAVLITVGKFSDIFGYDPGGHSNKVVKAADILFHPGNWNLTTAAVGLGTVAVAFALKASGPLARYALVLVVALGTAAVWIFGIDTPTIADQATIATGLAALPIPDSLNVLPDLAMVPGLLLGSFSIAIVALAQGAGIRPAFPNPDGSRAESSRDFLAQGIGNLAGAFFQSTPTGGSLSRTAVSAESGADRRWAGYVAAGTVVVLVVAFGGAIGHIPEAVIGGLLFVVGVDLVTGRLPDSRLAWQAGVAPRLLLAVTMVLTLTAPLQWAIIGGAVLSLLAYVGASSSAARLERIVHDDEGWMISDDVPTSLPADEPILLRYTGPNFFAVVTSISDQLPEPDPGHPGVLVVDLGALRHFSSTMLKQVDHYLQRLSASGSALVLTGVRDEGRRALSRTGLVDRIGERNILPPDPHIDVAFDAALQRGRDRLRELRQEGET